MASHTVTLHKDCKFTPVTLNVKVGDSVAFTLQNPTTIQFSNAAFWNPSTSSINSDQSLTVLGPGSTTASAPSCVPEKAYGEHHSHQHHHEEKVGGTSGDSCVITVGGDGHP